MFESAYAYTSGASGENSFDCLYSASKATNVKVKSIGLSWGIKKTIQKQPQVLAVAANNKYIHSYASGVIDASDCAY